MYENYDWDNPAFKIRAGESLNLAVNYVTDVLHTLYIEAYGKEKASSAVTCTVFPNTMRIGEDANVVGAISPSMLV